LLAESFLPHMNGVTHSLLQVLYHLERRGHESLVVAPRSGPIDQSLCGVEAVLLPSIPLPSYPDVRLALASTRRLAHLMREFDADVVHLASPFVLGWRGVLAAESVGIPSVAVYQTDIPAYAQRYGMPGLAPALDRHLSRLHRRATLTLAPSSSAIERLAAMGVGQVQLWGRGVDTERFGPSRRNDAWRTQIAPNGDTIVGYVGRLAPEKQVEDLAVLADIPHVRLVIVGEGPSRADLEKVLPTAHFTGFLGGTQLAEVLASFDVFVHPGEHETFCQTVQEALASGVPVVATGRGGPLDLVNDSVTGWLYRPGDLADLRERVRDLAGDGSKRRVFALRAAESVEGRGWDRLGDELLGYYRWAMGHATTARAPRVVRRAAGQVVPLVCQPDLIASSSGLSSNTIVPPAVVSVRSTVVPRAGVGAAAEHPDPPSKLRWRRYVALGDSLTEGLCDRSRMPDGVYRGWADRLALLLALAEGTCGRAGEGNNPGAGVVSGGIEYANLAVRSRRVRDVVETQVPRAMELGADLVSILIGANDLVRAGNDPVQRAALLCDSVAVLRGSGCDVLLVTPFYPLRPVSRWFTARFAAFNRVLRDCAADTGALLLDVAADPVLVGTDRWAEDRVHLNPAGHRGLAYAAAEVLGVPDAQLLAGLERAIHDTSGEDASTVVGDLVWFRRYAMPWIARRVRGRTAGEGMVAKDDTVMSVTVPPVLVPSSVPSTVVRASGVTVPVGVGTRGIPNVGP